WMLSSIAARWVTVFSWAQGCGPRASCVSNMRRAASTIQPLCGPQLNYQLTIHLLNEQGNGQVIMRHRKARIINQKRPGTSHDHKPPLKQSLTWVEQTQLLSHA
ncbi:hypothetical protein BGW80DRAFT_1379580, partial [Lactifluus volemus]